MLIKKFLTVIFCGGGIGQELPTWVYENKKEQSKLILSLVNKSTVNMICTCTYTVESALARL